jgi:hypothetical protein
LKAQVFRRVAKVFGQIVADTPVSEQKEKEETKSDKSVSFLLFKRLQSHTIGAVLTYQPLGIQSFGND